MKEIIFGPSGLVLEGHNLLSTGTKRGEDSLRVRRGKDRLYCICIPGEG